MRGGSLLIEIEMPPADADGVPYASIRAADETYPFEIPWPGDAPTEEPLGTARSFACLEVRGAPGSTVHVRARLCEGPSCLDPDVEAPTLEMAIEDAIYRGKTTHVQMRWEDGVGEVTTVSRCEVAGCIEGESTSYCRATDGSHFCESNPNVARRTRCPEDTPTLRL